MFRDARCTVLLFIRFSKHQSMNASSKAYDVMMTTSSSSVVIRVSEILQQTILKICSSNRGNTFSEISGSNQQKFGTKTLPSNQRRDLNFSAIKFKDLLDSNRSFEHWPSLFRVNIFLASLFKPTLSDACLSLEMVAFRAKLSQKPPSHCSIL